jgi:2-aminoadipate transaminase
MLRQLASPNARLPPPKNGPMTLVSPISQRARRAGGQPISHLMHKALAQPELISLAAGFVDPQSLPVDATRQAIDAVLGDPARARAALQYGTTPGYLPLREALVEQLTATDGLPESAGLSAERVVITAGSNQMLHLLADTLFDPGDIVLCAAPTYFVYVGLLHNLGVRSVGIRSDREGLLCEEVDEALHALERQRQLHRVKAIYVVSYYDNPSGATMSLERRRRLVELAKRWSKEHKIHVIEDAAYRELRLEGPALASMLAADPDGDTVIHTQTFSKCFSPGLRVGWAVLPEVLVGPVCEQKGNLDFGSPNFAQHVIAVALEQGLVAEQAQRLRSVYRVKRDAMLAALEQHLGKLGGVRWARPEGGLYVWLELPEHLPTGPDGLLFDRALAEGVLYVPGEYCYAAEGVAVPRNRIRLSYGVQSPERIAAGIAALARAVVSTLEGSR